MVVWYSGSFRGGREIPIGERGVLTYNRVTENFGDTIGLLYEKLVDCYIEKTDPTEHIIDLTHKCKNTQIPRELVARAKKHAQQEIEEAANERGPWVLID